MVNVIFNELSCEILPKQKETFDKYCKIIQWGRRNPTRFLEDFVKLTFTDHQKYILLSSWVPSTVVWLMSRSSGKALQLDTPIYVLVKSSGEYRCRKPEAKTIGDLKVGDVIYDADGLPTEVIHLNPIILEEVYEVKFSDGEIIKCNAEHLWEVYESGNELKIVDTHYIYKNLNDSSNNHRFYVPVSKIDYKGKELLEDKNKKAIIDIRKTGIKKPMRCITVDNKSGCFLVGDKFTITHNSYLSSPFMMARALLIPNNNIYIMGPSGNQAQETFTKLENLAKNNIASVIGVSSFFLDETVRMNSKADPFVHDKNSYHVELYNGSTINTLNSVAKNIVGKLYCRLKMKPCFT